MLSEIDGSVILDRADTKEEAQGKAEAALVGKVAARGGPPSVPAAASGVVELVHSLRAARVISFRRGGQTFVSYETEKEEAQAPAIPAAYDILCPFGFDIDRELKASRQPPAERVVPFVQKLGIPIVISKKKVETAPSLSKVAKNDRTRNIAIAVTVTVLLVILIGVVLIFRNLK